MANHKRENGPNGDSTTPVSESSPRHGVILEKKEEQELDAGVRAWLQVLGAFFLWFNSWGIINAFGVFQTYYQGQILSQSAPSSIAWIGSIQSFLLMFIGVLAGPLFDAGYFYALVPFGSFMVVFGYMMTSIATEYYQVMLAQGICVGIGTGCLFLCAVAIMPQYFRKRIALANGIAATGSSLGGVVYPIMFYNLQRTIGFPWATRCVGFVALGTGAISVAVMRTRFTPKQKRALLQLSAFKELPFTLFCFASFMGFAGFYNFLVYIQSWVMDKHTTNDNLAFYMLPILNAASTFGRLLPNYIADVVGPLNILLPAAVTTTLLVFCWIAVDSLAGTIVLVVLYGFCSGAFLSIQSVVMASITKDMSSFGTRLGMSFTIVAVALLIGTPIGGAILDDTGKYIGVQAYCGCCLAICAAGLLMLRMILGGFRIICRV